MSFLVQKPRLNPKLLEFGMPDEEFEFEWPTEEDFRSKILYERSRPKLKQIIYRCSQNQTYLTAIQFIFTDGLQSPLFDGNYRNEDFREQLIDVNEHMTGKTISMKTFKVSNMDGIQIVDKNGQCVAEKVWCEKFPDRGDWETRVVPDDEELIGFKVSENFKRLAFMTYRPRTKGSQ